MIRPLFLAASGSFTLESDAEILRVVVNMEASPGSDYSLTSDPSDAAVNSLLKIPGGAGAGGGVATVELGLVLKSGTVLRSFGIGSMIYLSTK